MCGRRIARFSDGDIRFLVETVAPQLLDRLNVIKNDVDLIQGMLNQEAERVFKRIVLMGEEDMMTSITTRFLFEVLLMKALRDLKMQSYTVEKTRFQKVPVFDAQEVAKFMANDKVVDYLADMLSSFTKTESFVVAVRLKKGIWRKFRFSDIDLDSLVRLCESVDEERRFALYKRAADLCLFILGMFPEHVTSDYRLVSNVETHRMVFRKLMRSAEQYEEEGRRFYKLAGLHKEAEILGLSETLCQLHENFNLARKPLIYISENLLRSKKQKLFPPISSN